MYSLTLFFFFEQMKTHLYFYFKIGVHWWYSVHKEQWNINIYHMSIYNICKFFMYTFVGKQNTMTQFFLGFSLYISNKTNKDDGVLCFKDTIYTRDTIPNPVNITCPYHGRYVIYYNNRTHPPYPEGYNNYAYIRLCKVDVYGTKYADSTPM